MAGRKTGNGNHGGDLLESKWTKPGFPLHRKDGAQISVKLKFLVLLYHNHPNRKLPGYGEFWSGDRLLINIVPCLRSAGS